MNWDFWNLNNVSFSFPIDLINKIFGTPFSLTNKKDKIVWGYSKSRNYTIKSAYFALQRLKLFARNTNFNWIWKIPTYPKIQFFIWLIVLNRNPAIELLIKKDMDLPPNCIKCHVGLDNMANIIHECLNALSLWHNLPSPFLLLEFVSFLLFDLVQT